MLYEFASGSLQIKLFESLLINTQILIRNLIWTVASADFFFTSLKKNTMEIDINASSVDQIIFVRIYS